MNLQSKDEIGELAAAFNRFTTAMHDVIAQVRTAADEVAQASVELSSARTRSRARRRSRRPASRRPSEPARHHVVGAAERPEMGFGARLQADARDVAVKGGSVVSEAVEAMSVINASSTRIADIITTIDEIAFQTNLLALNAAVEAARGRAGPRLRGRRVRGPQPRAAFHWRRRARSRR